MFFSSPFLQYRLYIFNLEGWNSVLTLKFSFYYLCRCSALIVLVQKNLPKETEITHDIVWKRAPCVSESDIWVQEGLNV